MTRGIFTIWNNGPYNIVGARCGGALERLRQENYEFKAWMTYSESLSPEINRRKLGSCLLTGWLLSSVMIILQKDSPCPWEIWDLLAFPKIYTHFSYTEKRFATQSYDINDLMKERDFSIHFQQKKNLIYYLLCISAYR